MLAKRFVAMIAAILLLASVFTGCGNTKKDAAIDADKSVSKDAGQVENMNKTGLPIVKEKVTLKAVMSVQTSHGKLEEMIFFKNMEEKTNVHIEWDAIPQANYNDRKNIILASGDLPDIFYGTGALIAEDISKYSSQGFFIELGKLIDNYAPNVKAAFAKSPNFKKTCTNVTDQKIYSVGRAAERETSYGSDNYYIYKPWLDKLGLKVPETLDDYYKVLKAFKEKDPNGNGKQDEIPFSFVFDNKIYGYHSLFGPFGRTDAPLSHILMENGKLVFTADKKEYKEAIKYYSKYFKEDLFDKEGFIAKDTKGITAKGQSKEVILGSAMAYDPLTLVGPDRVKDYVPVPPLKGNDGKQIWLKHGDSNGNIIEPGFCITNKNKYPEISIRWLDQHFDKQTSAEVFLGPLGENLKMGSNGMLDYIDTPKGLSYTQFRMKNTPVHAPCAIFADEWGKVVNVMAEDKFKLDIIKKYYKPYWTNSTVYVKFTESEAAFITSSGKDIIEYVNQMQAKWMLEGNIDQEWDSYLAKLKLLKANEYLKIYETAYARWNAK